MKIIEPYLNFWARLTVKIRKPLVIGITGSVGKSTTAAMISSVLTHPPIEKMIGKVGYTQDNMNDDIGLPATLLRFHNWSEIPHNRSAKLLMLCKIPFRALSLILGNYPKVLVLEYGAGWSGHMRQLINIVSPDIAIVTTIGPAHLERFKTLEGIAREKSRLVQSASPSGLVILGEDHEFVSFLEAKANAPVIKVSGKGTELSRNITLAVCKHMGIPEEIVSPALENFINLKGRLDVIELTDTTVIDDSYNANPLSVKFGLDMLEKITKPGQRRVAILGTMAELGEESVRLHEEVGQYARERVDLLVGVGELAKWYQPNTWFDNSGECAESINNYLRKGDCVFIKGSASANMGQIVKKLKKNSE
ncbi:UDP-N-acetylmuramoyl-tripeptide--D-alanyl-D-alanine ligase [Nitrosomonas nitrosa]|uniref:UDP-N-acetylmuramoyl-tripeptide--D-alanyl-D- alanine ligase n=1 Tax=Nitrosomonas nitrosa TaxID=52442 RepID=UPI000D30493B|nr:UDP-N-acetylmuramoyl-tripeptide--D-alanyl-D-alanine ligase [Nitrosomonas nitrosa]PTR03533.1 UDP-N-acetylmuramoyl-tripeptide--D-alanyl-D-alanine ligase [Nitrosomonas nitrosa]